MARLASQAKAGFYPTPPISQQRILALLKRGDWTNPDRATAHVLDPCCGEGVALAAAGRTCGYSSVTWGIELDADRAMAAATLLATGRVIQGSIFDAHLEPSGSIGLLWLNPPYDRDGKTRMEMQFLTHSTPWLAPGGVLVYLVPEYVLAEGVVQTWLRRHYTHLTVARFVASEYPLFRQVVCYGIKRPTAVEPDLAEPFPSGPYPYLDDLGLTIPTYLVPSTAGPTRCEPGETITADDLAKDRPRLVEDLAQLLVRETVVTGGLRPLFPLRKGHLVALLTAGFLDGRVTNAGGDLVIKGYSRRTQSTYMDEEEGKEITTDAYALGVRVIDLQKRNWYDLK